jgi:hypothetical protein
LSPARPEASVAGPEQVPAVILAEFEKAADLTRITGA